MTNLLEETINSNDANHAAKVIQEALGIESDDVANYVFPKTWPSDRELDGEDLRWRPIEDRARLRSRNHCAHRILALPSTSTSMSRERSCFIMLASSAARASCRSGSARHIGSVDQLIGSKSRTQPRRP